MTTMSLREIYQEGFDETDGQTITADTCPECSGELITAGGETTCADCGLIVEEYWIDHGPAHYTEEGDGRKRTGPPATPTRHDRGISSEIGWKRDSKGKALSGRKRRQLGRLRVQHSRGRWQTKAERNLAHGLSEVRRVVSALECSDTIRDNACRLFRRAQAEGLLVGRSIEAFAAASTYAVCRVSGLPTTMREVAEHASVHRDRIENAYSVLNRELGLAIPAPSPTGYVPRFATSVGVGDEVRLAAERLAKRAEEACLHNGRNPAGIAAACLYAVSRDMGDPPSQCDLAACADVSAMTVRNRWKEVRELGSVS